MRVLIAGCGYVGTQLGLELADSGHVVFGLRRDPSGLPAAVRPVAADLLDREQLSGNLPARLDAVVFAASPQRRDPAAYRQTYVDGPARLLEVLEERGDQLQRVVLTSSTAVYGNTDGAWVDEDTPTAPGSDTARVLVEAEQSMRACRPSSVVVRLAGIYGPGRTRLLDQVRAGEATCPPQPSYTNRIHRDDCAGVLAHVLQLAEPAPLYVGVDHEPAERCTVLRWLAARLGVPPPTVADRGGRRGANKRCRNDRVVASGYGFRYPTFRDGYEAML